MTPRVDRVLVTCEHAGNRVPARWRGLFAGAAARRALESHRGWDPGALGVARAIARRLEAPLVAHTTTRLLVEVNRSLRHRAAFSEFTRGLDERERAQIVLRHYLPHRMAVEEAIRAEAARGSRGRVVLHLGVHSFTPELDGVVRNAEVGLLYDPARGLERSFCGAWRARLGEEDAGLRVRLNYPYLGKTDGLTTHLRRVFPARVYLGVELEVNQGVLVGSGAAARRARATRAVVESLSRVLGRG